MRKKRHVLSILWLVLILALMYVPILILAVYSFSEATMVGESLGGFTFKNYVTLFGNEELRDMIIGTVVLAVVVAVISTLLGTAGAIGAFYSKRLTRTLMGTANQIPVVNADIVTGFSICVLLIVLLGIDKETFVPLGIGLVALCTPFVYLSVTPRLKQMDGSLYEAALDLGASPAQSLFRVVIPQISSGILSGFMMAITLCLDDYFITTYTKPSTFDTISTYVVNATKGSQTDVKTALWALSTLIFLIVLIVVVCMNVTASRREKNKR